MQQPRFNEVFTNRLISIFGEPRKEAAWSVQFYNELFDSIGNFKEAVLEQTSNHIRENNSRWPSIKEMKNLCFKFHRELKQNSGDRPEVRQGRGWDDYRFRAEAKATEFLRNFKCENPLWQRAVEEKFEVTLTWILYDFAHALWHTKLRLEDGLSWDELKRCERPPAFICDHHSAATEKQIFAGKFEVSLGDLRKNNEISVVFDSEFVNAIRRFEDDRQEGERRYNSSLAAPKNKGVSQVARDLAKRLSNENDSVMLKAQESLVEEVTEEKFEFN